MKKKFVVFMLIAGIGLLFAAASPAATYKYTDKKGNVGLADDLSTVPEEYRSTAVLIGGETKEEPAPAGAPAAPSQQAAPGAQPQSPQPAPVSAPAPVIAAPAAPAPQAEQGMPFSIRLAISIAVVVAVIFVSVFLGKVSAMHGHDKAIHILRVSLSWLVVVYLIAAHAKDVIAIFKTAGSQVQSVSDEAAKKGEKAAAFIKAMDAAAEQAAKQSQENEKALREAEQSEQK